MGLGCAPAPHTAATICCYITQLRRDCSALSLSSGYIAEAILHEALCGPAVLTQICMIEVHYMPGETILDGQIVLPGICNITFAELTKVTHMLSTPA